MIIVSDIVTQIESDAEFSVIKQAFKKIGIQKSHVTDSFIIKTSIDARHGKPRFVSSVGFITNIDEQDFIKNCSCSGLSYRQEKSIKPDVVFGNNTLPSPPVIAGFGPAGMFAGLILARNGYSPVIIERGNDVDTRVDDVKSFWNTGKLNLQSNVQFGEGGAGTFSDGKLTTRINDPLCNFVLNEFVKFGAPEEILKKAKPHIGTDYLRNIVKAIKKEIIECGGRVITSTSLSDIGLKNGKLSYIIAGKEKIHCSALILAIGHSARDTFDMLINRGVLFETKPFSIGVRIEHLQKDIDSGLYGKYASHPMLPKGEYQLSLRNNGRAVYTFCMCPGGSVIPAASESGTVVVNGMSEFSRNGENANSALVVSVSSEDFGNNPKDSIEFQRQIEKAAFSSAGCGYCAPTQTVGRFVSGRPGADFGRITPSYALGVTPCDFSKIFPESVCTLMKAGLMDFGQKIRGFDSPDAVLTGVETRTSSPVRICRNQDMQSVSVSGLYPCGEGAGYAGGIMSAAVDGIKAALSLMKIYKPLL